MGANALIDTGAILALLDASDRWHGVQRWGESFSQLRLHTLLPTSAEGVLTELLHLVGGNRREMESAWKLLRSVAIELAEIAHAELPQIHAFDVALLCISLDGSHCPRSLLWIARISRRIASGGAGNSACFRQNAPEVHFPSRACQQAVPSGAQLKQPNIMEQMGTHSSARNACRNNRSRRTTASAHGSSLRIGTTAFSRKVQPMKIYRMHCGARRSGNDRQQ